MNGRKLIFITSLERSGSTLLDITLGRHPNLVSFGEVARVLLPHDGKGMKSVAGRPCSCGAAVQDCLFWGPVTRRIDNQERLTLSDRYNIFLNQFYELYGDEFLPIDSSKFLDALNALHPFIHNGLDLKILFTIRDVRGWVSSSRRAERRKREVPYEVLLSSEIFDRWKPYLRHNIFRHFPFWFPLEWYFRNGRIERFLSRQNYSVKRISYERLALNTKNTLSALYSYIGIEELPLEGQAISHIVRGNRMAFDYKKSVTIQYDGKWMSEVLTQYEAMAWPFVMVKNKKWVYES